jgi:hypothetical protein
MSCPARNGREAYLERDTKLNRDGARFTAGKILVAHSLRFGSGYVVETFSSS